MLPFSILKMENHTGWQACLCCIQNSDYENKLVPLWSEITDKKVLYLTHPIRPQHAATLLSLLSSSTLMCSMKETMWFTWGWINTTSAEDEQIDIEWKELNNETIGKQNYWSVISFKRHFITKDVKGRLKYSFQRANKVDNY